MLILTFPHSLSGRPRLCSSCCESDQPPDFPQNEPGFSETGICPAFLVAGGQGLAVQFDLCNLKNLNININMSTNLHGFNPISAKAHYINVPSHYQILTLVFSLALIILLLTQTKLT